MEDLPLEGALRFARSVARKYSKDMEAESAAYMAVLRAVRDYDPRRGTLKTYIAVCVRTNVLAWIRSRKRVKLVDPTLLEAVIAPQDSEELDISREDWQLLVENHLHGWPVDVVARRHGQSTGTMRKRLRAARKRLECALQ